MRQVVIKTTITARIRLTDAAAMCGLSERTFRAMAARGEVPGAAKLGRLWTFDVERLRTWLEAKERATSIRGAAYGMAVSPLLAPSIAARYKQLIGARQNAA